LLINLINNNKRGVRLEFRIQKKRNPNIDEYNKEEIDLAYKYAERIHKEFKNFLKAVVLFGSSTRKVKTKDSDIDVLVVIDDISIYLGSEMVETYRIISQKIVNDVSNRLHITTMKFTSFWEYARVGDPIVINMLRDGVTLYDSGFFEPLQALLRNGRIRPTKESIWAYFSRAPISLQNSRWHLLQAVLDLYWTVIDASHAALMTLGEIPPTPSHVADLIEKKMVKKRLIAKKYVSIMRNFYKVSRMILHREIKDVSGEEFESYYKEAKEYVDVMKKFIESRELD
jgi:predicted nucleotidyltransferase/uncharacterized protein (UPF0332 family)